MTKLIIRSSAILLFWIISYAALSQNKWLDQIGTIHSSTAKYELLSGDSCYFEITETAGIGTEVIGRIGLANNSLEQVDFEIIDGNGLDIFSIEKHVNSFGKHFGILKVKKLPISNKEYTVTVKGTFTNGQTDTQNYTINVVNNILAEKFFQFVYSKLHRSHRLYFPVSDSEISSHLSKFNNNGTFSDLNYGLSKAGWEGLNIGAKRINNMAMAYLNESSSFYQDKALKQNIYSALLFNATEFAKYRTQWYETHLWRNTDYIAGIGLHFFDLLKQEMNSMDENVATMATKVYNAILDNCDNLFAERMYERPAIGNANRNHRLRSLLVRAAISYDYNRALSDWELWYDKVDPRIPGFYPDGAINDIMELIETSFIHAQTYVNRNGFFPDGTICHHPAVGIQFTADAYGWPWLTEWSIPLANQLKDTRFQAHNATYNTIAERLLDAYRPLTFKGYIDISVGGLDKDRSRWGNLLHQAVNGLIEAKSEQTIIERENELQRFKSTLENEGFQDPLSLSKAFWNIDYLIQRRPGYFISAKMISKRSRGLERGFEKRSNYYLGDGAMFVRTNADDYYGIEHFYNWHAIPGTTAEQRKDDLPPYAQSAYGGANGTNNFAGVVSNGSIGFGAFKYERNHQSRSDLYSTVNANKGYFFFEDEVLALGNTINRVRPGDNADIITTLDQKEWREDIIWGEAGKSGTETIPVSGNNVVKQINDAQSAIWFYHNKVGYIVVPKNGNKVNIEVRAETRNARWTSQTGTKKIFHLAINHGTNVTDDSYTYYVLPNTNIQKLKEFVSADLQNTSVIKNEAGQMVVYHHILNIVQAVFYEPGELNFKNRTGETIHLSVDRPSLVMMEDKGDSLRFTVTDPNHSTRNLTINTQVNIQLKDEPFDSAGNSSSIAFTHSHEEVYAGKPMTKSFATKGRFLTVGNPQDDQNENKWKIYYDRINRTIQYQSNSKSTKINCSLFNINGQLVARNYLTKSNIQNDSLSIFDTNNLPQGVYLVKAQTESSTHVSKILINF
jgi:hypothetical protein